MSASRRASLRPATTLVELMVTLAILATMAAIVGLSFRAPTGQENSTERQIAAARRQAILTARPVTFTAVSGAETTRAIALPDGSVIGASSANIDRMTGRPTNALR